MEIFGRDALAFRSGEHAGAAHFYLLKIDAAADIAQEAAVEPLDVGAGGDHVHGVGEAEPRRGAKLTCAAALALAGTSAACRSCSARFLDEELGLFVASRVGVPGFVGGALTRSHRLNHGGKECDESKPGASTLAFELVNRWNDL